jgi:surface antigen
MSLRGRSSLVLVVAAALLAAGAAGAGPRRVVVYGYPYASRCPVAGIAERVDRWGMYDCNCTSYVAWALHANGQRTDWFIRGAMDAWNWPHVAQLAGIPVGRTPRVGAVAVWPHLSKFGHVAYVTRLEPGGRFDVGEYNLPLEEGYSPFTFDSRRGVDSAGVVFIYVPRRSAR